MILGKKKIEEHEIFTVKFLEIWCRLRFYLWTTWCVGKKKSCLRCSELQVFSGTWTRRQQVMLVSALLMLRVAQVTGRVEGRGWELALCNILTALSAVDTRPRVCVCVRDCGQMCMCLRINVWMWSADLTPKLLTQTTTTYTHRHTDILLEEPGGMCSHWPGHDHCSIEHGFPFRWTSVWRGGKQTRTFLPLCALFIMNRPVSQSLFDINNAHPSPTDTGARLYSSHQVCVCVK